MNTDDIVNNDLPKYAIAASGIVATIVFSNLLVTKIHEMHQKKQNLNVWLVITGLTVLTLGVVGSQYFKYKEKKNGNNGVTGVVNNG